MKLTKGTKKLLNIIIKAPPTIDGGAYDISEIAPKIDCTTQRFFGMLNFLENNGAITFVNKNSGIFLLTEEGREYKHIKRQEMKEFLFKSIILPIFVSVITTGILYTLERLLQY